MAIANAVSDSSTGDDYHANFMVKLPIAESVLDAEPVENETDCESISGTDLEEQLFEEYYNICVLEKSTEVAGGPDEEYLGSVE